MKVRRLALLLAVATAAAGCSMGSTSSPSPTKRDLSVCSAVSGAFYSTIPSVVPIAEARTTLSLLSSASAPRLRAGAPALKRAIASGNEVAWKAAMLNLEAVCQIDEGVTTPT
jgi:hypothetical protein